MTRTGQPAATGPRWSTLTRALLWRARREGVLLLAKPLGLLVGVAVVYTVAERGAGVNGAAQLGDFAARLGVTSDAPALGSVLVVLPGMLGLVLSAGGAGLVRNLVGAEASQGSLEAVLASGVRPRSLATGLLAFAGAVLVVQWVAASVLATVWLRVLVAVDGASLHLSVGYGALLYLTPLLTALAGTALALAFLLLAPRYAQQGQLGLSGGSGYGDALAVIPAVVVLLTVVLGSGLPIPALCVATAVGSGALLVGSVAVVSARFRPESVLAG